MAQELGEKFDLERRSEPTKETPARNETADTIEAMWPEKLEVIAEEDGSSRQHIRNTISSHFRQIPKDDDVKAPESITIEVPAGADPSSYLRGVADAYEKAN